MLEYRLDDLHWSDFERLCQALLKARLSVGVEAWGGSGDWGNDAYCRAPLRYPGSEVQEGPFQFQAKFVEGANAAGAKPREPLVAAIRRECQRIKARSVTAPRVYSLLTNTVLSPQLRKTVEDLIRDALPGAVVVVHGGNDICSWLHMQEEIVRSFPQLLSHRNLSELVKHSLQNQADQTEVRKPKMELSALLKKKKKQARAASRKHNVDSAVRLWRGVQTQADKEGNKAEAVCARLEIILTLAQNERNPSEALKLADECLQDAKSVDLGDDRCRLLQLIGEVHRVKGDKDRARGFIGSALEHARAIGSRGDEGFALLSLSALERVRGKENNDKALELIGLAYDVFSALYASGDQEKQKRAKDGFAQCHCWRAEIFDHARPDDALVEWTRALETFQSLGEGWEWNVADTFLHRADLRARIDERQLAADDLGSAGKLFERLGNTMGLAKCYLKAGEFLDGVGKREEAFEEYQRAGAIAATWKNDSRASYFYFRYACKLVELHKYDEAEPILIFLANADWLEPEHKLTVIHQLCFLALALNKDQEFKERCTLALALIEELIQNAVSANARRGLLVQKGTLLEQSGRHEESLECFKHAIEGFEQAGDKRRVIECWSHIRGVMQKLDDPVKEREAAERILALDAEKVSPMIAAMTLVMLAQLNIEEQRFSEAREQIDRARKLDAKNPAVAMIAADLQNKLPKFSSENTRRLERLHAPPDGDLPGLLHELEDWCGLYPARRKTILAVWYYIHRVELWNILRSMLGIKFMICADKVANFESARTSLREHGDLFVWATNFEIKPKALKSVRSVEKIPVPKDFLFPAGTTLVTGAPIDPPDERKPELRARAHEPGVLRQVKELPVEPYYIAFMKSADDELGVRPYFVGRKQAWSDLKVVKFMLGRPATDLIADKSICLPLNEGEKEPNLKRSMDAAWENGAIPVFHERLPQSDEISCICDSRFELPAGLPIPAAKELWQNFLSSCVEAPKSALTSFINDLDSLRGVESRQRSQLRVYVLRFRTGGQEVVHPAVVTYRDGF
jgi:tetratricopeptide (TPR) repeat protein